MKLLLHFCRLPEAAMIHEYVKNPDFRLFVIPAEAGNHKFKMLMLASSL
jgi:hypothetical protein